MAKRNYYNPPGLREPSVHPRTPNVYLNHDSWLLKMSVDKKLHCLHIKMYMGQTANALIDW